MKQAKKFKKVVERQGTSDFDQGSYFGYIVGTLFYMFCYFLLGWSWWLSLIAIVFFVLIEYLWDINRNKKVHWEEIE